MTTTHISLGLTIATRQNADAKPKAVTIRILPADFDNGIKTAVVIGGKFARPGDMAEVTELEAKDLIQRGRAELVAN